MTKAEKEQRVKPILAVGVAFIPVEEDNYVMIDYLYQTHFRINQTTHWIVSQFKTGKMLKSIAEDMAREFEIDMELATNDVVETYRFCKKMKMVGKKTFIFTLKQKYLDILSLAAKNAQWY